LLAHLPVIQHAHQANPADCVAQRRGQDPMKIGDCRERARDGCGKNFAAGGDAVGEAAAEVRSAITIIG